MQDPRRPKPPAELPDAALWRHCRTPDAAEDETARYLDLAAYADGVVDPDERARIAEWLAHDPDAAADVKAAQELTAAPLPEAARAVVARACALALSGGLERNILPFRARQPAAFGLPPGAGWAGLAAAVAVVAWLGFTLGMSASLSVSQLNQGSEEGFFQELLNPPGFIQEPNDGMAT